MTAAGSLTAALAAINRLGELAQTRTRSPSLAADVANDVEIITSVLTNQHAERGPDALRELLIEVIPAPRAPQHVRSWPQDEQELYDYGFEQGLWSDFTTREQALDLLRRGKVADTVLAALRTAGALTPTSSPSI